MAASFLMIRPDLENLPPIELPQGYTLRTYQSGDEVAWCALMEGEIGKDWTLEKWRKEMEEQPQFDPDGLYFVVWEGEPVASACAWSLPDRYGDKTGVLHMVAVRPDHRGKRLGRIVSLAVLHFFREKGYSDAALHTDENRRAAVRTYYNLGFRPKFRSDEEKEGWERLAPHIGLSADSGDLGQVGAQ